MPDPLGELSSSDAQDLSRQIAGLASGGMPLAAGLRAAADEATSSSLAAALRAVAADLERGRPLEESLLAAKALPAPVVGLVRAGQRSGRLGHVLVEITEQQRAIDEAYRAVYGSLAYPAVLFGLSFVVLCMEAWWFLPIIKGVLLDEFDVELPPATRAILWLGETGVPLFLGTLVGVAVAIVVARVLLGAARSHWILAQVPLFGPLWHDAAAAEFSLLMSLLLEAQIPLPEALRLTADGLTDASVAEAARRLAESVELGGKFPVELAASRAFPASLVPLVEYGDRTSTLSESFRTAGEMFLGRVRLRASLLTAMLPPFAFLSLAASVGLLVSAVMMPLVSLIKAMSY